MQKNEKQDNRTKKVKGILPRKNILLVGARYSKNLGDDVIYDVVSHICERANGIEPVCLSISGLNKQNVSSGSSSPKSKIKKYVRHTTLYKAYVEKRRRERVRKALSKTVKPNSIGTILFAGGQLFMDIFIPMISEFISFAEKNGICVIFNCIGLGHISKRNLQILSRCLISPSVISISLRDNVPYFKTFYRGNLPIRQLLDPGIHCNEIYSASSRRKNVVGIGIISIEDMKERGIHIDFDSYKKNIEMIIQICNSYGKKCELFCNGEIEDFVLCKKLKKSIAFPTSISRRPETAVELVNVISSFERIYSFRLHSHIIAASFDIPSYGFIWDEKVKEFFRVTKRENFTWDWRSAKDVFPKESVQTFLCKNVKAEYLIPESYENLGEIIHGN